MKFLKGLLGLKVLFLVLACFTAFDHPHIIRQQDTMGVSLRYWLRWFVEPSTAYPLLPAVISAGDSLGIAPMEFPFLNLITAPFFMFGPFYGRILAGLFLLALVLGLTWCSHKVWEKVSNFEVNMGTVHILLVIFGISSVYIGRFMPDYLAFILVLLACGLSYERLNWKASLPLAALGLLIKPPAIIAMGIMLVKNKKALAKDILIWVVPAMFFTIIYYTWGMDNLRDLTDIRGYYKVEFRNPAVSIIEFFSEYKKIPKLLFKNIFPGFTIVFILVCALWKRNKSEIKWWAILGLQLLAGIILDGSHAFIHDYYFIGTSATVAIILVQQLGKNKYLTYVLLTLVGLSVLERGIYETRDIADSDNYVLQCKRLREKIPDGEYKIRSRHSIPAHVGTCMGMIQNSKVADFGVFTTGELSKLTEDYKVIDKQRDLTLVRFE